MMPQNIPADTRKNLPAGQQCTQRLVDQFNADEQNWCDTRKMVESFRNDVRIIWDAFRFRGEMN
jgi:hypothetical protein